MTLGAQAHHPHSELCQFLDQHLPQRDSILDEWRSQLTSAPWRVLDLQTSLDQLGEAFEMRVGLDLANKPGCMPLLGYLPPNECRGVLETAGFEHLDHLADPETTDPLLQSWTRATRAHDISDHELDTLRSCLAIPTVSGLEQARANISIETKRSLLHEGRDGRPERSDDKDAMNGLIHLWRGYLRHGREPLLRRAEESLSSQKVKVAPILAPGFAKADLVVGRTLIDIKVWRKPAEYLHHALNQVLGYLLLDRLNLHRLQGVGLYLGWQGLLLTATVERLLSAATPRRTVDIAELREQFDLTMRDTLDTAAIAHSG